VRRSELSAELTLDERTPRVGAELSAGGSDRRRRAAVSEPSRARREPQSSCSTLERVDRGPRRASPTTPPAPDWRATPRDFVAPRRGTAREEAAHLARRWRGCVHADDGGRSGSDVSSRVAREHAEAPAPVPAGLGQHWSRDQRRLQRSGRIRCVLLRRVRRGLTGITRTISDAAGVTRAVRADFTARQTVAELAEPVFVIAEVAAAALRPALLRDRSVRPGSGDRNARSDRRLRVLFLIRAAATERERQEEQRGAPEERGHTRRILQNQLAVAYSAQKSVTQVPSTSGWRTS
jgi:hypothetical protein